MINPKTVNITRGFVVSGVREIGQYIYILLIDLAGQTLIKRVKSDNSEIKFTVKDETETIDNFWIDPTVYLYEYINKV